MTDILKDILLSAFPGRSYGEGALDGMAEAPQVSCGTVEGHGLRLAESRTLETCTVAGVADSANAYDCQSKAESSSGHSGYQAPPAGKLFTGVAAGEAGAVTRRAASVKESGLSAAVSRGAQCETGGLHTKAGSPPAPPEYLTLTERCLMVADRTLAERRAK